MHKMILDATIAKVRQRASEGDCPITPPYSVEHLETALLTLAATPPVPAQDDDKLRVAVEAMQGALDWDKARGYRMPYRVRDPLYAAIDKAALQQEIQP